jgi:2-dehydro-3-deoxyphosphooctonate aldolase (KDO 8-P synthase)
LREMEIGGRAWVGADRRPLVIAGPCVIESEEHCLRMARALKDLAAQAGLHLVFKASFDKANRSSIRSFRGPGLEEGLRILARVKAETSLPVLSDIHHPSQAAPAARVLDVLQIPAFLCRQTDLLLAAAETGRPVNVKKGQFLSPWEAGNIVEKIRSAGNSRVLLTERGTTFGYQNLVVDFRSVPVMQGHGCPVIFDATHSVQRPGQRGDSSGGDRAYIPVLARAGIAAGADGLFTEVHDDPDRALSDGPNALPLSEFPRLLQEIRAIGEVLGRTR